MNFVDIYQKYWKNGYTLTDLSLSGIDLEVFRSLFNPVAEVFRKYPAGDCHLYTFGPGVPILGPELVVNGDFSNGTTGWASANAGMSVVAGELVVTATTQYGSVTQNVQTKIGATYQLTGVARLGTSTSAYAKVRAESGGTPATQNITSTSSQQLLITFVATSAVTVVEMQNLSAGLGTYVIDAVTFKEILGYSNTYSGFVAGNHFDSAGTTHASVEGSVGMVLDAAGSVGAELFSNFSNATGWLASGGVLTCNAAAYTTSNLTLNSTLPTLKTLRVTYTISGYVGGAVYLQIGGGTTQYTTQRSSNGTFTEHVYVTAGQNYMNFQALGGGFTGVISLASVREVTGIHATQSTPGYKPTLRKGVVNLQPQSADVTATGWSGTNVARTAGVFARSSVAATCYTSSPAFASSLPAGTKFTAAALVKAKALGNHFGLRPSGVYPDRLDAVFNLSAGTVLGVGNGGGFTGATASISGPDSGGFYMCAVSGVVGTTPLVNIVSGPCDGLSVTGWEGTSTTLSDCYIAGLGLFAGTLTAAQILAAGGIPLTTTAPASSQAGVNYLEFDGVDDRLALGGPLFQMADDHCVVVGFQPKVLSAYRSPFFPAANSATSARIGVIGIDPGGSLVAYYTNDAGVFFSPTLGSVVAGESFVASVRKVGAQFKGRKNGGTWSATQTPTGTYTLDTAAIGNGTGFGVALGNCYPIIAIKGTVSDADLFVLEKFVAQLSGVIL